MCGLVGVISKTKVGLFKNQVDMFKTMLWADQLRGVDGTGVAYDTREGIKFCKAPVSAAEYSRNPFFNKCTDEAAREAHFIVGHNRAATKGNLVWKDTHPFVNDHITLMHNGTLWNHDNLDKTVDVDSHAICSHMSKYGAEKTIEEIDGAFALIWIDSKENTLNLTRNDERPLHLIETKTTWIISSELGLGVWMAERSKLIVENSFELEPGNMYTFDINDMSTYKITKVKLRPITPVQNKWCGGWWPDYDNKSLDCDDNSKKNKKKKNKGNNVIPFNKIGVQNTRPWGTRVTFAPWEEKGKGVLSCIFFDEKQQKNFLLGKLYNEPSVEIRVYDTYKQLAYLAEADLLEGTVVATTIRGSKVTHRIENAVWIAEEPLSTCSFCTDDHVLTKDIKKFNGHDLCPMCFSSIVDDPTLAREIGYTQ